MPGDEGEAQYDGGRKRPHNPPANAASPKTDLVRELIATYGATPAVEVDGEIGRGNPASHRPSSMQPPVTTTGVAPWGRENAALHARLDAAGKRDPRGVPNPRISAGRPPRPPPSLAAVGESEAAIPQPLPAFDASTAASHPTDWEDDDTVAPWAEFSDEAQAARLAELEAFNAELNEKARREGRAGPSPPEG